MDKEILTAEQIVVESEKIAQTDTNRAIRRQINKLFREQDSSKLYPIRNNFHATNRAIGRARRHERLSGVEMEPLEYALFLDLQISSMGNQII